MLDALKQIFYPSVPLSPRMAEKQADVNLKVRAIARRLGLTDWKSITASVNKDFSSQDVSLKGREIVVPPLLLINPRDIPQHLKLSGIHDPRLQSEQYLEEAITWAQGYLQVPNIDRGAIRDTARLVIRYMANPELAETGMDFALTREVASIGIGDGIQKARKEQFVAFASIVITAGAFELLLLPSLVFLCCFSGHVVTVFILHKLFMTNLHLRYLHSADYFAGKPHGRGGVYLYETLRQHNLAKRNDPNLGVWQNFKAHVTINEHGDYRAQLPPLTKRIGLVGSISYMPYEIDTPRGRRTIDWPGFHYSPAFEYEIL